ncbi:MAG TPA: VOC family protein [Herpetosiphonaceae bacterium]
MKSQLAHIQFNVQPANVGYYKELLTFLGWQPLFEQPGMIGLGGPGEVSLWFLSYELKDVSNDYDGPGMNHLALGVESIASVDAAAAYLREHDIEALFETPRHRAEFAGGEDQTYYQVMFKSPDNILFEIVYTGPKHS